MSKYKPGDKFEIEVTGEVDVVRDNYYVTTAGIINEEALDGLKKIEPAEPKEPEVDWGKVEVDTPIWVKSFPEESWVRRHFARCIGGKIYAWDSGLTSWSARDERHVCAWNYAKLAEVEDD